MSDTTPRPDEMTGDPTAPPQPADVEVTEIVPTAADAAPVPAPAEPQDGPPAPAPPAYAQPASGQPQYEQQQYGQQLPPPPPPPPPPPAYAAPAPGTAMAGPNPMSPTEERTAGLAAHGVALAATVLSGGFLGFVAALVMYLVFRDRGPFARYNSANALNVQIIAGIVILISFPLMFVLIGFVSFAAAWLFAVIVHVVGMVKANNGEWWTPPMTPQFVK